MVTDTDIRLRSALDSNQRDRERMCRSILALDPRYSEVRPRHPLGGRDGGRDIQAIFQNDRVAFGAVGFSNGANDSVQQKKKIKEKFRSDVKSALEAKPDLKAFAFLTNVTLTMGEQESLRKFARLKSIEHCEILDRERIRVELDSPRGYFIRFQYLNIPLSEAEQASFLSHYGDRIQEVVSSGFGRVEKTLSRILFLQESLDVLNSVNVRIKLKRTFDADEIGHFRAYWLIALRAIIHDIFQLLAGESDLTARFNRDGHEFTPQIPGIRNGIASGQWESYLRISSLSDENIGDPKAGGDPDEEQDAAPEAEQALEKWEFAGSGAAKGEESISLLVVSYEHDDVLVRLRPRLQLRDLDDCMFMPMLNLSLAEKVESFDVFANGYLLLSISENDFVIDRTSWNVNLPGNFTDEELADPWVRIRPSNFSSAFHIRFSSLTPRRMYNFGEVEESRQPDVQV